jgi:hypothetical protein
MVVMQAVFLVQTADEGRSLSGRSAEPAVAFEALFWLGGLVLGLLLTVVVLAYIRKRLRQRSATEEPAFTLQDLRRMRDDGRLSTGEYEALRRRMLEP